MSIEDPRAWVGRILAERYPLESFVHAGMDLIYRTHDPQGTPRVVKLIVSGPEDSAEVRRTFMREAKALARVYTPYACAILDYGVTEAGPLPAGLPYLIMEEVAGESLEQLVHRGGPLSPELALTVLRQIGEALTEAHAQQVLHRNVKAGNVFLSWPDGKPHAELIDFDIAVSGKRADAHTQAARERPRYYAPEQCGGAPERIGKATDVYGAAQLFYELVAGRGPFAEDTPTRVMLKKLRETPLPLPSKPGARLPKLLDQALASALEGEPQARPQTVAALIAAVEKAIRAAADEASSPIVPPPEAPKVAAPAPPLPPAVEPTPPPSKLPWLVAGLALTGAAAAAAWYFLR